MTSTKRLRKVRGTIRASGSRNITLLTELLQNPDAEAREINRYVSLSKTKEAQVLKQDMEILDDIADEAIDSELESAADYNEKILFQSLMQSLSFLSGPLISGTLCRKKLQIARHKQPKVAACLLLCRKTRSAHRVIDPSRYQGFRCPHMQAICVEVREEGKQKQSTSQVRHSPKEPNDMSSRTIPTPAIPSASALATIENPQPHIPSCPLCNSRDHGIAESTANIPADEKRAKLRNAHCCYRCDTRDHVARFCRVSRSLACNKCQRRHLTVLCELSGAVARTANPGATEQRAASGPTSPTVTTASAGNGRAKREFRLELPQVRSCSPPLFDILSRLVATFFRSPQPSWKKPFKSQQVLDVFCIELPARPVLKPCLPSKQRSATAVALPLWARFYFNERVSLQQQSPEGGRLSLSPRNSGLHNHLRGETRAKEKTVKNVRLQPKPPPALRVDFGPPLQERDQPDIRLSLLCGGNETCLDECMKGESSRNSGDHNGQAVKGQCSVAVDVHVPSPTSTTGEGVWVRATWLELGEATGRKGRRVHADIAYAYRPTYLHRLSAAIAWRSRCALTEPQPRCVNLCWLL
ncbi:hypothetical protein HPB49_002059 [Dermacentor silvarum]|uniref:Uncharacterized protein n=1 Tax=Dermacentor silvarum TaxID=543639 RepID=A0ACB8DT00_DERSI|nr:hypothetical protein HPB49_002059 [Dermacentor silvarum]